MSRPPASRVRPHPFAPDPDIPPGMDGRGACASCHLIGEPGDARHTMPVVPEQAEVRRRYDHEEGT